MEALNLIVPQTQNLSTLTLTTAPVISYAQPYQEDFFTTVRVLSFFWPGIIFFGLCSNITNLVVFLKAGVKDNVTVLLLSLAISDVVFLMLITPSMCFLLIYASLPTFSWPFDPSILKSLMYWPAFTAYDLSAFISVSLGVTRCACVAMPLKFKFVFTKMRTIKWVIFLVVLAISLRLPVLTIHRISYRLDPKTNISSAYMLAVNREHMSRINDILNRSVVIYLAYGTMVTCVAILVFKLHQAARVRRACTGKFPQSASPDQASDETSNQEQLLSAKDVQVVKSVVLVCTIFIVLQLPFVLVSTIRLIAPEFDNFQRLVYLFGIFSQISRTCAYLNASLNIFIYYNYNSRYRSVFCSLLQWN
ncbi:chemosensory receptor A [Elysia marginata]|uniref:Chemosensory receptor A n=1 Tax=Elysia marginata TaxID=1093978 RepID=A0AAV4IKC9_9GAST|nr:chemosensory receptor A [Elysia marginata]